MRFAVIGIGNIGWTNVPALMAFPEAQIVAVANRTAAKAEAFCGTPWQKTAWRSPICRPYPPLREER